MIPRLSKVIIEGFGIFKDRQEIDLSKIPDNALIGIFGENTDGDGGYDSNGSGKTTFTNAISWCIFNKIPIQNESSRAITKEQIVNKQSKRALVALEYIIDQTTIFLESTITIKGTRNIKLTINGTPFNANTDSQIMEKFYSLMGIGGKNKDYFTDFLNRCYFSGDVTKSFASKNYSDQKRAEIVSKIRKLEIYNIALKDCTDRVRILKNNIQELNNFKDQLIQQIDKSYNIDEAQIELDHLLEKLSLYENEKKTITKELEKYNQLVVLNDKKSILERELNEIKNQIDSFALQIKTTLKNIHSKQEELKSKKDLKLDLKYNPKKELKNKEEVLKRETELKSLNLEVHNLTSEANIISKEISSLLNEEYHQCPNCSTHLIFSNNELLKVDINVKQRILNEKEEKKLEIEEKIQSNYTKIRTLEVETKKLNQEIEEEVRKKTKIEIYNKEISKLESDINSLLTDIKPYIIIDGEEFTFDSNVSLYESYEEYLDKVKEIDSVNKELDEIKNIKYTIDDLNNINKSISNTETLFSEKRNYLENQLNLVAEIKENDEELKPFEEEKKEYDYWIKGFTDLKNIELLETEPLLENTTNNFLQRLGTNIIVDYDVDVENEGLSINLIEDSGETLPLELFSTGQSNRIGFSAGLALAELAKDSDLDYGFSMWDEVLDGLDNTGQDHFYDILRELTGLKFVISHDKKLQNYFEHRLKIIRKNHQSKIILEA